MEVSDTTVQPGPRGTGIRRVVVVVPSALEVPEGLAAWAVLAVVFLVNLQAWRQAD